MEYIELEHPYKENKHVAVVKLNRPKVLNALSTPLMEELVECFQKLDDNDDVRAIILTGNGRAFAAGADIAGMAKASPMDQLVENRFRAWNQLDAIQTPIIAAVHGFALGGGCELAMSCDFMVAADNAKFGQPEIKIGTMPGAGGTQRLTRAIGKARAMHLILTGEMIDAMTAAEWGLVAKIFPEETLMEECYQIAKSIAELSPVATRLAKQSVKKAFETSLKDGLDFERHNFFLTFSSEDQKEGMKAFLEKRTPNFVGR